MFDDGDDDGVERMFHNNNANSEGAVEWVQQNALLQAKKSSPGAVKEEVKGTFKNSSVDKTRHSIEATLKRYSSR